MKRFTWVLQNYLMFALPFVIGCGIWSGFRSERELPASIALQGIWEVLSWNLMMWFGALILFLILLVTLPEVRERTLKRLANLQERDEREEYITGRASRSAYISSLSLLILLLFISMFSVGIYRVPASEVVDGRTKRLSMDLHFNVFDQAPTEVHQGEQVLFESKDIPLSKTAIIFVVLCWQLFAFNLTARRQHLRDEIAQ